MAKYWHFGLFMCLCLLGQHMSISRAQEIATGCSSQPTIIPGVIEQSLEIGDLTRRYRLYVPENRDANRPLPVVMSFHGFASSAAQQAEWSNWDAIAEREGFIAVYPQGSGFPPRWYNGINEFTNEDDLRDMAFVQALLDTLNATYCVDNTRIYATGFSAGAGMAYRLACELADRVTAIGTVGGAYSQLPGDCMPARPIPIMIFHGDDDQVVPYDGRGTLPNIPAWAAEWADRNQCATNTETLPTPESVIGVQYSDCAENADVVFYTLVEGGHTWPGQTANAPAFLVGAVNQDIDASETMWVFFSQYTLENTP